MGIVCFNTRHRINVCSVLLLMRGRLSAGHVVGLTGWLGIGAD
jgi:hypothetical protein